MSWPATLGRLALRIGTALCVVAIPIALVCANVRLVTLDRSFYLAGFARYGGAAAVGLSADEQRTVADTFIAYFLGPPGRLDVQLAREGTLRPLFNEREIQHMADVQALMQLVFGLGTWALGYIVVWVLASAVVLRGGFRPLLARVLVASAVLTLAAMVMVGALALVDFDALFLRFHFLAFDNDLWQLDPARDNLIRLFPAGFWFEAALRVLVLTVVEALALGSAGVLGWWLTRERRRAARPTPAPRPATTQS
ncbi:MAG: TIGR01906 family membrane protein [Chloroflexi bacterium]|nr:TIGR01906 family membrane protein [Chloroflexota bacterium]